MTKKSSGGTGSLGRALQSRGKQSGRQQRKERSSLHHSNDVDGAALASILDASDLNELMMKAELAGRNFAAERMSTTILLPNDPPSSSSQLKMSSGESQVILPSERRSLRIPRRPEWDMRTTAEELEEMERNTFLEWRGEMATAEEVKGFVTTPFEKNLEVWRQLWRVVERSDVLVQILDARNPLLYHCEDLEHYVSSVDDKKRCLLLLNKADLLDVRTRENWASYFRQKHLRVAFFSAQTEGERIEKGEEENESCVPESSPSSSTILGRSDFLNLLKSFRDESLGRRLVVGLVGYPNVGKSSTLNVVMKSKKVGVSSTPGKTKHFQTLIVDEELELCDCPGLVFPNFAANRAELVCAGVLPIDQMRDARSPVSLLCARIPARVLRETYGIVLTGADSRPSGQPTAAELLNEHARARGFTTDHGGVDEHRSARILLKDLVNGKLVFCEQPPNHLNLPDEHASPLPLNEGRLQVHNRLPPKKQDMPLDNPSSDPIQARQTGRRHRNEVFHGRVDRPFPAR
mmetsp:Transcript_16014/g.32199  ORF Transcript_16014/g.32199 Transcript_16014/m.32199 type:complete len:519 (-) Transcript_16014:2504-4060(-)